MEVASVVGQPNQMPRKDARTVGGVELRKRIRTDFHF
jgi:hypothetical protein